VAIRSHLQQTTRAHALLTERRRVILFAMTAEAGTPQEAARRIGAAVAALGIERFDVMGEGAGAAAAVWLALARQADIGSVALAAPDGLPDEAFRGMKRPVLVLSGTKDQSDAGDRYRRLLLDCHFMFVYDAGHRDRAAGGPPPTSRSNSSSGAISSSSAGRRHGFFRSLGFGTPDTAWGVRPRSASAARSYDLVSSR